MLEYVSTFAIIIAFVSVIVSIFTFTLKWRQSNTQQLVGENQFISEIQNALDLTIKDTDSFKIKNDCVNHVRDYLNIIDRLCFFQVKYRLQDSMEEFFINYLTVASSYYQWLIEINIEDKDGMLKKFPYILKTCNKLSIPLYDGQIDFMEIYENLPDKHLDMD